MATPLLRSLRSLIDGELWAIGKSKALELYNGQELFNRFIPYDRKGFLPFLDLVNLVKDLDFARSVITPHSFRSALLFYSAQVGERIGYARNKRGFMLTHPVEEKVRPEPTVEHYLKIIDAMGGKRVIEAPVLSVTNDEEGKFDENHMDMRTPYVVFITGAQYGPSKCWPDFYFSELADRIAGKYAMNVYILPGTGEEGLAHKILDGARNKERIAVKSMGIRDLKVCLSRASAVVSNDTGPRHISVALSVPTVVLLGPMDEQYTRYPSSCTYPMYKEVPCRPCNKKRCSEDHACLKGIMPDDVFKELEGVFERRP
ncbi:MAG: ADP-heptose--LPS heptosyltransferase 2 [Syntrophorhabdus sp. PtaU1.Bin002]|nr:MAG: ADP-heptose--LPS heptosyltransferase 2 [Syntrophorhabdus sp. PtaB.Bin006]OPY72031.1 MAG: ADP-heptose--LPS heptosyltransferase 2 [Syntrophorhabdus sp. PtaU1.Bin002]